MPAISCRAVEKAVRARLADWRALLTDHVRDGRELLRRTLAGPMKFTPTEKGYRFEGEAAIGRLLEGVACVTPLLASPASLTQLASDDKLVASPAAARQIAMPKMDGAPPGQRVVASPAHVHRDVTEGLSARRIH
jgi:hypothetical protein